MTPNPITSVSTLLQVIEDSGLTNQPHAHVRIWFRGQGDASWTLCPGVYRDGFSVDDKERVLNERHLTQDFDAISAPLRSPNQSRAEIYFIQQHYRMPTRLLDWSLNLLAALFFALTPADKDGSLFVLDAYKFGTRGLCTTNSTEITEAMKAIFEWDDQFWPKMILAVRPPNLDRRISAQRGCFTFHPPSIPELKREHNSTLRSFKIPATAKERLRKELELLGIDEFAIFGDLDHLAERLKRAYRKTL